MLVEAAKYHSYGNDFLIVAAGPGPADRAAFARAVCDPHFGVGGDGCVFLERSRKAEAFEFRIHNRDGGQAGMSGNGLRCAAAFLLHRKLAPGPAVLFRTASGEKTCELLRERRGRWLFASTLGSPSFEPREVPFVAPETGGPEEWTLEAAGRPVLVRPLSVGNPQCVVLREELPGDGEFSELGPALESHPRFPERTNVSFVRLAAGGRLRILIWERGVGPTHSSGTGSCGAAVAAIRAGLVTSPVEVETATGVQTVEWKPGREIVLTGWADFIADVTFLWRR